MYVSLKLRFVKSLVRTMVCKIYVDASILCFDCFAFLSIFLSISFFISTIVFLPKTDRECKKINTQIQYYSLFLTNFGPFLRCFDTDASIKTASGMQSCREIEKHLQEWVNQS